MAAELAPYREDAWARRLEVAAEIARQVGPTEFVPSGLRNRTASIVACVLYGAELGLEPMQSLAKIAVIEGRPAPSAELALGLALAAGHQVWIEESTITKATIAGHRAGSEHVQRVTWTMDDARRARLDGKPVWRQYPRRMLQARATAELLRMLAPDVLGGITLMAEEVDEAPTPHELTAGPTPEPEAPPKTRKRSLKALPTPAEPEPDAEPLPEPSADHPAGGTTPSAAQKRLMFALFHDVEVNDDPTRYRIMTEVIGREITSTSDLTRAEMQTLLDWLEGKKAEGWVAF